MQISLPLDFSTHPTPRGGDADESIAPHQFHDVAQALHRPLRRRCAFQSQQRPGPGLRNLPVHARTGYLHPGVIVRHVIRAATTRERTH